MRKLPLFVHIVVMLCAAATQLASAEAANRITGGYAMAGLADDRQAGH